MSKVQVLVAAMNQQDHTLLDVMNIQSDVIVGNQCSFNSVEDFTYKGFRAKYLNFAERGVGLNRNNTLMRADGDFVLFADDDIRYHDGYVKTVCDTFKRHPNADVLIFNLDEEEKDTEVNHAYNQHDVRVNWLRFLRYGTPRIAARLQSIRDNAIYFNQCFGGGTPHRHGEDNLFLAACLRNKLKIYAVSESISTLKAGKQSSWNVGYDTQYLHDQGDLYRAVSRRWWRILCIQNAIKFSKTRYHMPAIKAYQCMLRKENAQ